ncbi:MAG: hypothetical protein R6X25_06850 [Candidatus Krumholzibacteriia bacterium]
MMHHLAKTLLGLQRPDRLRHYAALRSREWLSREVLADESRAALTAMLRHACATVPFYRDVCAEAGLDPAAVTGRDLHRFPLVTKRMMTEGGERFHDATADRSRFVPSATGGSTGVWFRFFVDARAIEYRAANDMRSRTWTGWRPGDKQAILWGHAGDTSKAATLRGRLVGAFVLRARTLNAYSMDDAKLQAYYRELRAFRPRMILGYASALAFFAEYVSRRQLSFPSPAGMIASAETLTDDHRATIESVFSCPLLNRYGSREFAVIAQQCPERGGLHVFDDMVHLEVLRPDGSPCGPGERGELVITDLSNRVMPFIRYRTGDLAVPTDEACSCGRGYPLLAAVEGRTSELIVGRNGKYYSCQSPRLFGADIPGIGQMQLIQDRVEAITVRIVPDALWGPESHERLVTRMRDLLGDVEVTLDLVDEIPPAPSGKYRFTISSVSPWSR